MKKTRIGIIGAGNIAREHLRAYAQAENAEVTAICDVQADVAADAARQFSTPHTFGSIDALVESPEVDAVVLAVPNYVHQEACEKAAKNGKHVFCEKPMTMTVEQGEHMVDTCQRHGVQLLMGFVNRFLPEFELLKEFALAGEFGDIYFANTSVMRQRGAPVGWFSNKAKSGGGALIDIGVHMIDVAWYIMGRPKPVRAKALQYAKIANRHLKGAPLYSAFEKDDTVDVEDASHGLITFENGAGLMYQACWTQNGKEVDMSLALSGDAGGAQIDPVLIYKEECGYLSTIQPPVLFGDCFVKQAEHFARVAQGIEAPRSPGEDGVNVQRMLCGLYRSAETGREVEL